MDKGKLAESFMSLVMERPQAAAVIGDLLETEAVSGEGWFWAHVIRTWFGTVWSDARAEPRFVLGMAALGAFVCWGIASLASMVFFFSSEIVWHLVLPRLSLHAAASVAFGRVQMLTELFAGSFYAGQWIARNALGREIAVCVAMTIVGPVIFLGMGLLFWLAVNLGGEHVAVAPPALRLGEFAWFAFLLPPYLLGAGMARRRRQAGAVT